MARWQPPQKPEPFVPWKPDVCEAPGCKAHHPSFSAYGMGGPWTCAAHRGLSRPSTALFGDPEPTRPPDPPPDRLL